ncbi:hypothetical protein [Mucilaginibacter sp.]
MQDTSLNFPVEQQLQPAYLKEHFWKCNYTSVDAPLQYWILLPNTVKPVVTNPVAHTELKLTSIGQYCTVDNSAYLEVQMLYEHVSYEMNAADWLLKKLAIMSEVVLHVRELKGKSTGNYLDVLTCSTWPNGDQMVSRFTVLKDYDIERTGANLLCVKVTCKIEDYPDYAYQILQIAGNWNFIHLSDWQMAEYLFPFEYDFTEKVSFYLPESWEIQFETNNTKLFSRFIFIHTVLGKNKGIINACFYALAQADSAANLYQKAISNLLLSSPEIQPLQPEVCTNPQVKEFFTATGTLSYEGEKNSAYLKIYILKTVGGWYYFEQIGPKPNLENDFWEVNKRAMEIVTDSFNNRSFDKKDIVMPPVTTPSQINPIKQQPNRWLPINWST